MNGSNFSASFCNYNHYTYPRYLFTVFVGSPFAFLGIFTNILLVYIFRGRGNCSTPTLYFTILAILDIAICSLYILLFSFDAIAIYHRFEPLWRLWMSYVMPLLTLSRIIQLASTYIVVAATLERFLFVNNLRYLTKPYCSKTQRGFTIGLIFISATILRSPTYFEYRVIDIRECNDIEVFASMEFNPLLANNTFYTKMYNFYFMHTIQVFMPILALLILNVGIVYQLQRQLNLAKRFLFLFLQKFVFQHVTEKGLCKEQIRSATSSLVAMVTSYLVCNSTHLLLSVLEHVAKVPILEDEEGLTTDFYNYLTDIICFLFMFNSFLRLFIYMACNYELRKLVFNLIIRTPRPIVNASSLIFAGQHAQLTNKRRRDTSYKSETQNETSWPMLDDDDVEVGPEDVQC